MVWLITGLLLAVFGGVAVLTRWARRRPVTDDTLLADLLGPPARQTLAAPPGQQDDEPPAGRVDVAPLAGQGDDEPSTERGDAALPAGQEDDEPPAGRGGVAPPPVLAAQPAGEGSWLETQIASIAAWSERMQEQIASWADDPDLSHVKGGPEVAAPVAHAGRRTDHESREPPQPRPVRERCMATTAKGSQCKLPARPGEATCATHTKRAHP
jgi:hypothetical protein